MLLGKNSSRAFATRAATAGGGGQGELSAETEEVFVFSHKCSKLQLQTSSFNVVICQ